MNIEKEIAIFKKKAEEAINLQSELENIANNIRSFFKYQNESTDSKSEQFIVTVVNEYCLDDALEMLEELEDFLEEE